LQHVLAASDGNLYIGDFELSRVQSLSRETACSCGIAILRDIAVAVRRACRSVRAGSKTLLSGPREGMQDLSRESKQRRLEQGNTLSGPLHHALSELLIPHQEVIEFDLQGVFPEEETAPEAVPIGEFVADAKVVEEFPKGAFHRCWGKGSGRSIVAFLSGKDLDGEDAVLVEAGLGGC
jgi:hypothetical protein